MICSAAHCVSGITTARLRRALAPALAGPNGDGRIIDIERRPSAYYSSFRIEELDVRLACGKSLPMIFKDVSPRSLLDGARHVKPDFIYSPRRELLVYREILTPEGVDAPLCHAARLDARAQRYWLFLERVEGQLLWQFGEPAPWCDAARWLARLHGRFANCAALARRRFLVRCDADYFRIWIQRAQQFTGRTAGARKKLAWLAARHEPVVETLVAQPRTLIHNEFYASNILIQGRGTQRRVRPVDWEMAGIGPGLIDLAALTAGNWTDAQRFAMEEAYRAALPGGMRYGDAADFRRALDCCRLHVALQWMGWSSEWHPPREHAQDWLGEAMRLAKELGL